MDSPSASPPPTNVHPSTSKSDFHQNGNKLSRVEELFQLAGLNKLAATSTFGLKVSSIVPEFENLSRIVNIVGDAEGHVSPKSEEESRKIFIPVIINGFRVAGHLDSGSDVSIMQFSLFLKLRKATKTLLTG